MNTKKMLQWLIAIIGWLAIILQFYLMIQNRVTGIGETIIRFFSFFTILTNLLVAICFTSLVISQQAYFFSRSSVFSAITVYIFIVGLVYNTVLRSIWNPKGLQLYVDEALHVATPVLCLIYWFVFVPAKSLKWSNVYSWLLYPLIYLIYVLIRGAFSHFYPYPFLNVDKLGYSKVFINSIFVTAAFFVVSLLVVWLGRSFKKTGI